MTISTITTDNLGLAAGLPFEIRPDTAQFAVLVAQEPSGNFAPVQSSGGTLAGGGGGGGSGGVSSTVTLAAGTSSVGTFALSAGTTLAVSGTFWQATQPVSGTISISGTSAVALSAGGTVAVASVAGTVTTLPSAAGTQAVSGTLALSAGTSNIGTVALASNTFSLSAGQTITLGGSNTVALAAGASSIGTVAFAAGSSATLGAGASNIGTIAGSSANIPTYLQAVPSGGCSLTSLTNSAASSIIGTIKAGSGQIFGYDISNSGTAAAWVRFYASATGTVGVGTPVMRLYVPPASARTANLDLGAFLSTGIVVTATAGAADADTSTIATANQVEINVYWK